MAPDREFAVINERDGQQLASRVTLAGGSETRRKGLLSHAEMPPGFGLWIVPCEAVHTFWMRFPIDVVFLNRDKQIVKIVSALKPWRLAVSLRAHSVLELASGIAKESGAAIGDQLRFR